jgi:cobyrinic acid a,c-diamide synthase
MFHRASLGISAYNLDPYFLDGDGLRAHLAAHAGELSVIEGAMGYYDGIAATDEASAYTVARETGTPVVLVISAKGAGRSLGAVIEGFARHRADSKIAGVIFNDATEGRYPDLTRIAEDAGVRAYGYMPRKTEWSLSSRHLGLLSVGEITNLKGLLLELGRQATQTVDIDGLLMLAKTASVFRETSATKIPSTIRCRLAVARDEAFCFLYEENLEMLEALGCETVFFSPLNDKALPSRINGLYLCGGYPELHVKALLDNTPMLESIRQAMKSDLPTVAEGGGFMYLHDSLDGAPMCGVIHGTAYETKKLQRFGYISLTAERDNMLCKAGESIRSHEFHYWDSSCLGDAFIARKAGRDRSYSCVQATDSMYAGFPQLYFPANPSFAKCFVERMSQYEHG